MAANKHRGGTDSTQVDRFKAMARELGADESAEAFDRTLKRVVPGKPAPVPAPVKRAKKKAARAK